MPLDDLPPDLYAALSLLVDRGKSYEQIAELLGIPESAVRDRAHAALDLLAGATAAAAPPIAATLPTATPATATPMPRAAAAAASPGAPIPRPPISRRGGAVLLGAIVVAVVVVVVVLTGGSGGSPARSNSGAGASSSGDAGSSASKAGTKASVTNQVMLSPPNPASKAVGIVEVLAEGSQRAIYLAAEHLAPTKGFFYVLWLYNSPASAEAIGKTTVPSSGRMQAAALLPADAGDYHHVLLTRETSERPATPGPVVLSGAFSLGS